MVLLAGVSAVLNIPCGYANAIKSLEKGSRLLSFSTLPLDQVANDDVRFDVNTWEIGD